MPSIFLENLILFQSKAFHRLPTPLILFFSSLKLVPGIYVPLGAKIVFRPSIAFEAPQTTLKFSLP